MKEIFPMNIYKFSDTLWKIGIIKTLHNVSFTVSLKTKEFSPNGKFSVDHWYLIIEAILSFDIW